MSDSDLDRLYRSASAQDTARPSAAARQAILDQARQLAAQAQPASDAAPRRASRWRALLRSLHWQFAAPVAAALLAAILLAPQWRTSLPPVGRPVAADHATGAMKAQQTVQASAPQPAAPAPLAAPPLPAAPARSRQNAKPSSNLVQASPQAEGEALRQSDADARADLEPSRPRLESRTAAINARDRNGRTALMLAVMHDQPSLVRELLARGADPNIADLDGRTPLSIAREHNEGALISALLAAGAR